MQGIYLENWENANRSMKEKADEIQMFMLDLYGNTGIGGKLSDFAFLIQMPEEEIRHWLLKAMLDFWDIVACPELLAIDYKVTNTPELPDEHWTLVENLRYIRRLRKARNKAVKREKS